MIKERSTNRGGGSSQWTERRVVYSREEGTAKDETGEERAAL
jgi:hypothetical protein